MWSTENQTLTCSLSQTIYTRACNSTVQYSRHAPLLPDSQNHSNVLSHGRKENNDFLSLTCHWWIDLFFLNIFLLPLCVRPHRCCRTAHVGRSAAAKCLECVSSQRHGCLCQIHHSWAKSRPIPSASRLGAGISLTPVMFCSQRQDGMVSPDRHGLLSMRWW